VAWSCVVCVWGGAGGWPGLVQTGDMGKTKGLAGGGNQGRTPAGHKRCIHGREERNCKECGGCAASFLFFPFVKYLHLKNIHPL
jgi:hypothetical protein